MPPRGRRRRGAWLALLALTLAVPLAAAQAGCEPVDVVLPAGARRFEPGTREIIDLFLQNRNDVGVAVRLNVSAPSGWRALVEDDVVDLGPRSPERANSTTLKMSILAPERGAGLAAGEVAVAARATCLPPVDADSPASAASVPVRLAEPPSQGLALGIAGVLAGSALVAVWRVRRTRPLVRLECAQPELDVQPGKGASFPLRLENVRSRPDAVTFRLEGIPLGWTAFLPLAEAHLEPGETKDLWLLVRPPPYAPPGSEARIVLRAVPRAAPPVPPVVVVARVGNP